MDDENKETKEIKDIELLEVSLNENGETELGFVDNTEEVNNQTSEDNVSNQPEEEEQQQTQEGRLLSKMPGKAGRPKGAKDSKKRVSIQEKMQAKALYIAGNATDDIATALDINSTVIKMWASKEKWNAERDRIMGMTVSEMVQDMIDTYKENLVGLKTIRERAMNSILGKLKGKDGKAKDRLDPTSFTAAANTYFEALELEYKLKQESLQYNFIQDVAQAIKDEVHDRDLLTKIGTRLRNVFEKYQQRVLVPSDNKKKDIDASR